MGKPLSLDLRNRIVALVRSGISRRAAAERFDVSPSSAVRFAKLDEVQGDPAPDRMGRPPGTGKLAAHRDFLCEVVDSVPDITGPELAAALRDARGIDVHPSSILRVLKAAGYTYKKIAAGGRARTRGCPPGTARVAQAPRAPDA